MKSVPCVNCDLQRSPPFKMRTDFFRDDCATDLSFAARYIRLSACDHNCRAAAVAVNCVMTSEFILHEFRQLGQRKTLYAGKSAVGHNENHRTVFPNADRRPLRSNGYRRIKLITGY